MDKSDGSESITNPSKNPGLFLKANNNLCITKRGINSTKRDLCELEFLDKFKDKLVETVFNI